MILAGLTAVWQNDSVNLLSGLFGSGFMLFGVAIAVIAILGLWKTFEKAGQPGWACIIPIYNVYVLLKIAGRPGWWLLLYFVPIVNFVIAIVVAIDVAKAFGQSAMFGVFLLFLFAGVGFLVLGFGNYQYRRPVALSAAA